MQWKEKYVLTEEQRRMYTSEKLTNFRWIFKILATRSSYLLTKSDLAAPEIEEQLAVIGQFAEMVYSAVPLEFLFENRTTLLEPGFPLEGYHAIQDTVLVSTVHGSIGHLPALVAYCPSSKQLVVAISGTASLRVAFHDLRALKHMHPSHRGHVHSGFWALYQGLRPMILPALKKGLEEYDVTEMVITGHSMGGSLSYLLCMELLADVAFGRSALTTGLSVKLVVFGAPRTGDASLVTYWRELIATYRMEHGLDKMTEHSVKAFNDGVPSLPPLQMGYRHFATEPFYLHETGLYHVSASESEHALFAIATPDLGDGQITAFPRGGHNYYNGRDFEKLCRRLKWLGEADPSNIGWDERYRTRVAKRKA